MKAADLRPADCGESISFSITGIPGATGEGVLTAVRQQRGSVSIALGQVGWVLAPADPVTVSLWHLRQRCLTEPDTALRGRLLAEYAARADEAELAGIDS